MKLKRINIAQQNTHKVIENFKKLIGNFLINFFSLKVSY